MLLWEVGIFFQHVIPVSLSLRLECFDESFFKPKTELLSFFISWRSFADVFIIQLKQAWICFCSTKGHFHDGSAACLGELSCYSKLLTFSIPHLVVSPVQHHIGNFCFQTVEHRISEGSSCLKVFFKDGSLLTGVHLQAKRILSTGFTKDKKINKTEVFVFYSLGNISQCHSLPWMTDNWPKATH